MLHVRWVCVTPAAGGLAEPANMSSSDSEAEKNISKTHSDQYEPIKRLALVQIQPPRNPNKPLTPFSIRDILNGTPAKRCGEERAFIRPWDDRGSPGSSQTDIEEEDDDEEDIDVDIEVDDIKPKDKSVSPLDALFKMTSKTFEGIDTQGGHSDDTSRRDQLTMFSKTQPPKKRRKSRTAFTNQQIYELEKRFLYQKYLTPADRDEIAQSLNLTNAQVITWFQNRRAKLKRDLEELKADVSAAKSVPEAAKEINIIKHIDELQLLKNSIKKAEVKSQS